MDQECGYLQSATATSSLTASVLSAHFQTLNSPTLNVPSVRVSSTHQQKRCSTTQSILTAPLFSWYTMATLHEKPRPAEVCKQLDVA